MRLEMLEQMDDYDDSEEFGLFSESDWINGDNLFDP